MVRVRPFPVIRPLPNLASRVAAVPYDVVDTEEARHLAEGNPWSFLHVSRADIDLVPHTDPYADAVYARARENLQRLLEQGVLLRDPTPRMYVYRLAAGGRRQTGLACTCHVDDYARNVIRRHEKTRPDKERDRTRHILATVAHTGPVFLVYRDLRAVADLFREHANARPLYHFNAPDGVTHTIWTVPDDRGYREAFAGVPAVYVADGHHRAASALAAATSLRGGAAAAGEAEHDWFLTVLFPASQVAILPYNRVVKDLQGRTPEGVLAALRTAGALSPSAEGPPPPRRGAFGVYLAGRWHRLQIDPASIDRGNPVASLDVAVLQDRVLGPVLGIGDPRTDPRIEFVGGARGTPELQRRVDSGRAAIAFALAPTTVDELLAVADAGLMMPPKSTWFEPKLRSGLLVHPIA